MAQTKLSDFFVNRKSRNSADTAPPSKRRKIMTVSEELKKLNQTVTKVPCQRAIIRSSVKVQLRNVSREHQPHQHQPAETGLTIIEQKPEGDANDREVNITMTGKTRLLAMVEEVILPPDAAVSPLPGTPERQENVSPLPEAVLPSSPKLQNLSQKLKALSKIKGRALTNSLKQNNKLKELKQNLDTILKEDVLAATSTSTAPHSESVEAKASRNHAENRLPAHQRFSHLVEDGPPSLSLPFTYKLLESSFQAMDTMVSMMHNRAEMCTFSKLKAAVQNMTKKNFEEKTVGQIRTLLPEAYIFRQEKNIPSFGKKTSGYQLTIEANLAEDCKNNEGPCTADGKPTFTASILLKRKIRFRNSLIGYLKQLHKVFLASLPVPLAVPDDKLTRWHPRFQLDQVVDVTPSSLPAPPDVRVYHSAKDVLESQKGRLNPQVEAALSKVAAETDKSNSSQTDSQSSSKSVSSLSTASSSVAFSAQLSSLKGIPPALLAKIRAKEAQKMTEALTRNPADDEKTRIMGHLPEIIRILRTYFVTEQKPALPLEAVYKKLEESYRFGMSQKDLEQHVEMLKELAPELISIVEIKRGKFVKLDKNVDMQTVCNRIQNLVKARV